VDQHYTGQAQHLVTLLGRYDDEDLAVIADFMAAVAGQPMP
jgi:hypothetical protein